MKFKRVFAAVMAAALAVTICGCNDNSESPNTNKDNSSKNSSVSDSGSKGGNSGNTNDSGNNNDQNGNGDIFGDNSASTQPEPVKVGMWDVLPEIPVTAASAFKYEYSSSYGGMVVTDYLKETPKVRIPDTLEGEPVVYVDLSDCNKDITELIMPDTVNGWKFNDKIRSSLKYINYPRDTDTERGYYFKNFSNIDAIYIAEGVTKLYREFCYGRSTLKNIVIPDSMTSIGGSAFNGCENVNITYKGKTYTYDQIDLLYDDVRFGENDLKIVDGKVTGCRFDATQVTIPDGVTAIGEKAFSGCSDLTSVTIPNSVTAIGEKAFSFCSNLTSVTILGGVTEIGESAFAHCESLTSVTIPNSVTAIGEKAFSGCSDLTSVTIPDSVTKIGNYAFSDCSSLTSITIPDSVIEIGNDAFSDCSSLTSITIPDSVTKIGKSAFSSCKSLTSITIPDSVTEIGNYAFSDCSSLTSVTIPNSVTEIGYGAFDWCEKIQATYKGKTYDYAHINDLYSAINGN